MDSKDIEPSILKKINPEYSLKGLLLKRKLQYFGHMMQRADSLEKTLMLRKTECRRRRGWQRMRLLDGIINSRDMNLSKFQEIAKDREAWHAAVHVVAKTQTWMSDWTMITTISSYKNRSRDSSLTCPWWLPLRISLSKLSWFIHSQVSPYSTPPQPPFPPIPNKSHLLRPESHWLSLSYPRALGATFCQSKRLIPLQCGMWMGKGSQT